MKLKKYTNVIALTSAIVLGVLLGIISAIVSPQKKVIIDEVHEQKLNNLSQESEIIDSTMTTTQKPKINSEIEASSEKH